MSAQKQYTDFEVQRHNSRSSCWMIIDNKVYDVTPFLDEHPGGEDILIESSGRDATREFEDVGHSEEARAQLAELCIGDLRVPTEEEIQQAKEEAEKNGQNVPSTLSESSSGGFTSIAKWIVPLLIAGIALLLRKYATDFKK